MIILLPLTYLILLVWLKSSFKKIEFIELLASTNLFFLGLAGLLPFILREYANIDYKYSIFEIMIVALVLLIIELFVKKKLKFFKIHKLINLTKKPNAPVVFLIILGAILFLRGLYLPLQGWDAVSMYDSRARMFLSGLSLRDTKTLSDYDDFNPNYYFSYPPMTSTIHTVIYSTSASRVMWVYALFYMSFIYYLYLILKKLRTNRLLKILLFVAVAFNPLIVGQINIAYTNLPMIAFQTGSLYYLMKYIENRDSKLLITSAIFLSFSNWTRSLEPIFIGFILAAMYAIYINKKLPIFRKIMLLAIYAGFSLLTRVGWTYYVRTFAGSMGGTDPSFYVLISKLIESIYLGNIIVVAFFVFSSLAPILPYISLMGISLIGRGLNTKSRLSPTEIVLIIIFTTMTILMLGGTLYFSVTFYWWDKIGGSLLRSNLLFIPLISIFAGVVFNNLKGRNVKGK